MRLERSKIASRLYIREVTVATFMPRRAIRSGSNPHGSWIGVDPPRPTDGAFPPDGVAFRVYQQEGGPGLNLAVPEPRFPLRLSDLEPDSFAYAGRHPRPLAKGISAAGRNYTVYAWAGPRASPARRAALADVLASLSFRHVRPGTVVGYGFSVFDSSRAYPVGSFTRVRAQRQPFYLVHAPGGFYAIGWKMNTIAGGYKSQCALRLDRSRNQFFCTNMHLRWDRIGRVLVKPDYAAKDPLNVATVKLAWDGHVLLYPGIAAIGDHRLAVQLWPSWARTSSGK
jgi:hypothetical protein